MEGGDLPEAANDLIATLGELGDEQTLPAVAVVELAAPPMDETAATAEPEIDPQSMQAKMFT